MQLQLKDDLPFTSVMVSYKGNTVTLVAVLVDTGSASTVFAADKMAMIQITPQPEDELYTIRGVGGTEVVFTRRIDQLRVGDDSLTNFEIEVAGMDYGFEIEGILGMDFFRTAGAIINLHTMELEFPA